MPCGCSRGAWQHCVRLAKGWEWCMSHPIVVSRPAVTSVYARSHRRRLLYWRREDAVWRWDQKLGRSGRSQLALWSGGSPVQCPLFLSSTVDGFCSGGWRIPRFCCQ
jgi:hypothetical protein